ncbi:MAG TPA: DUF4388 domain-containing protein [Sandaracinaceae bacterium LLY-WYZ-13_1]|nr:DUF4388 domain-containing protein [Sandaracinaceae bacterium LLY-WYZ-13_1]
MARPPVLSGEIPEGGAIELLRDVEMRRLTGVLCFEALDGEARGEIALFGGEIAVDQPEREDGRDPVDVLLSLGAAHYEVHQRLPPLPVSRGDDLAKSGSLAVHVPADLMNYCEHAGLTGVLELRHEGRRAEAVYDAGELLAIELDGEDSDDLHEVFGWEQGRFRVAIEPRAPARLRDEQAPLPQTGDAWSPAPPKKREDTRQFLRVVQMALADVMHESERARSPTRTSPPLPPPPKARPRPATVPPPKPRRRDEQTVRLIYLTGDAPAAAAPDASTRHVRGDVTAELALTDARPERRATPEESEAMAKKRKKKRPAKKTRTPEAGRGEPPTASAPADEESAPASAPDGRDEASSDQRPRGATADDEAPASDARAASAPDDEPASNARPESAADGAGASDDGGATGDEADERPEAGLAETGPSGDDDRASEPSAPPTPPLTALGALTTAGWTLAVIGVGVLVLVFLSVIPPVSCPPGRESCGWGTGCVNTSNDPEHCGGCNQACASGSCVFGECAEP